MARCIRGGNSYKRHKVVNNVCVHCGAISVPHETATEIIERAADQMARQIRRNQFDAMLKVLAAEGNHIG